MPVFAPGDHTSQYEEGEGVRIEIPDESDPDHDRYHGSPGEIVEVLSGDLDDIGDDRDAFIHRVDLDECGAMDLRFRDLYPPRK